MEWGEDEVGMMDSSVFRGLSQMIGTVMDGGDMKYCVCLERESRGKKREGKGKETKGGNYL
jgi:hypothetical protein